MQYKVPKPFIPFVLGSQNCAKTNKKKFPKYKQPFVVIHLPSFSQETHSSRVVHRTLKQQECAGKETEHLTTKIKQ
jgi:hypothetical protein